jgi:hypothetical protein
MKHFLFLSFGFFGLMLNAQEDVTAIADSTVVADTMKPDPKFWKIKALYTLNGTQSAFINWNAGGRNNISAIAGIIANANYKKDRLSWTNDLSIALGGLYYTDKSAGNPMQKTDDRIDVSTNFGYKIKKHIFLSTIGGFRTQMLDGFNFPNDSVRVSTFMAPAYVSFAIGIDYIKDENFSVFSSPLAAKMTFVNDQVLSNAGAFGVTPAVYDGLGNVLTAGKRFRGEFGAYIKVKYNRALMKNVDLKSKLELFSNYAQNPQNIDVNAEALFNFKINSWLAASIQWTLIYDDDIDIRDVNGNVGPRTQFKSVMGIGITYKMEN